MSFVQKSLSQRINVRPLNAIKFSCSHSIHIVVGSGHLFFFSCFFWGGREKWKKPSATTTCLGSFCENLDFETIKRMRRVQLFCIAFGSGLRHVGQALSLDPQLGQTFR